MTYWRECLPSVCKFADCGVPTEADLRSINVSNLPDCRKRCHPHTRGLQEKPLH
jgi:hypothetical protein